MSLREDFKELFYSVVEGGTCPDDFDIHADMALKLIEKRIDKMIKVAYKKDPVSVWPLTQVKELLK
jgi:hypothetical protein